MKKLLFILLLLFTFVACEKHVATTQLELDTTTVAVDSLK